MEEKLIKNGNLSLNEKIKRCYDIVQYSYDFTLNMNNKINIYLAYGSSFLLIYFFNNINILKEIISPKILFILAILPVLTVIFSLINLYLVAILSFKIMSFITAKHSFFIYQDEKSLAEYEKNKNTNLIEKLIYGFNIINFILMIILAIEIGYIFYLLIF